MKIQINDCAIALLNLELILVQLVMGCIKWKSHKKKELRYRERNRIERIKYYRLLRELIKKYGVESLIYIDESEFESVQECLYAWSKRGKKVRGEKQGKRKKREKLVVGRRKRKKDLIAPMIFVWSLNCKA